MRVSSGSTFAFSRSQTVLLIKRIALCYVLYSLTRIIFYIANQEFFRGTENRLFSELLCGLRFDSFAIILTNSFFIVLSVVPFRVILTKWYQRLLKGIFISINSFFIALNLVDVGYFAFTRKRSTADLFHQLGGQSDIMALLPAIMTDYWWLLFSFAGVVAVLFYCYPGTRTEVTASGGKGQMIKSLATVVTIIFIGVVGLRGGLQPSPIDIVDAGAATGAGREAIVLNTPFTIIKSIDKKALPAYDFYSRAELDRIYPATHHFPELSFSRKNLVVIILESFSKGYTSLGGGPSYTPFLDSLMKHSTVFTNAYSNSAKSIEGIPAILSSMPTYMDNPYINSRYANNRQTSFATLLRRERYNTAFFHGGRNGTMNFTEWSRLAGYQAYHGMDEFNDRAAYDGFWGIYDEPFMQYCAGQLGQMKPPFHAAMFTLSSHHPYLIPEKYRSQFKHAGSEIAAALLYADHSLRKFFETSSKSEWYHNTLFVLVADHAAISKDLFIPDPLGNLRIPIVIFDPEVPAKKEYANVFGQIDILPEVMYRLGYDKPFFSFGKQVEKKAGHFVCYYGDGRHQLISDSLYFLFSGTELREVHNYVNDSALSGKNRKGRHPAIENEIKMKYRAMLQRYSNTLISDNGFIPDEQAR